MAEEKNSAIDEAVVRFDSVVRKYAGVDPEEYREDGFKNVLTKWGTSRDSSEHYQYESDSFVNDQLITSFYESNGIFSKIIDNPSEESVKHGFELEEVDDDTINNFYKEELDDLGFEEAAIKCIEFARLYGGAIAVLLINDGRGLEEPLDWANIKSVDSIRVFERPLIQCDTSSLYRYESKDPFRTRTTLGLPEYYHITSRYGNFTVHQSRCLVFQNGPLPENASSEIFHLWGVPEYIRIKNAVRDTDVAHASAPKLLDRAVQPVYRMKDLSAELSQEGGEERVLQRLNVIDMSRGLLNTIAIDADGEDYDFKSFSYSGVAEVISTTCNYLSAITSIPQTILFGRSPAGMNATGESDLENYYNFIERIQKKILKPNIVYLLKVLFQAGVHSGAIKEVPHFHVKFCPLWSMSETEQVSLDMQKSNLASSKASTTKTYVDIGAISPDEVRKELADSGEYDVETMLDDYTPEELEANKPDPPQQEQGGMMPGMGGGAETETPPSGAEKNKDEAQVDPVSDDNLEQWKKMYAKQIEEYRLRNNIEKTDADNLEEWKRIWKDQIDKFRVGAQIERTDADNLSKWKELWKDRIEQAKLEKDIKNLDEQYRKELKELWHLDQSTIRMDGYNGSVGVVVLKGGSVLCGRRISNTGNGQICGPGGHIETGETPRQAAIRETQEEFGITPKNLKYVGRGKYEEYSGMTPYIFVCNDYSGIPMCDEVEMTNARFVPIDKLKTSRNMFEPFKNGIRLVKRKRMDGGFKFGFDKMNRRRK